MARSKRGNRRAPARGKRDPRQLFQRAGAAFGRGDFAQAEALLRELLVLAPRSVPALNNLGYLCFQRGDADAAVEHYAQALALQPDYADALLNLGIARHALGESDAAEESLRAALRSAPGHIEAMVLLGNLLAERDAAAEAAEWYRHALVLAPAHSDARWNLALLLAAQDEHGAALEQLQLLAQQQPARADVALQLGLVHAQLQQHEAALDAFSRATELAPTSPEAWFNLGRAAATLGQAARAETAFARACELGPQDVDAWRALAEVRFGIGDLHAAETALREALARAGPQAETLNWLGYVLSAEDRLVEAEAVYRQWLAQDPQAAVAHNNLGLALGAQGRRAEAQDAYARALDIDPHCGEAWRNLVHATRIRAADDPLLLRARGALEETRDEAARMHLLFALGKALDDCGEYAQAFACYAEANALYRAGHPFDAAAFAEHVSRIIDTFDAAFLTEPPATGEPSERPVFIVGLPRSGTSLIEQIIAAHPEAAGAGELRTIEHLIYRLERDAGSAALAAAYPEAVRSAAPQQLQALARSYLEELTRVAGPAAGRVTDKMPFNFLHLGLIAMLLPRARIVHVRREPLDTLLSNYFQYFPRGAEYAYDLGDLAAYYADYVRLMRHWRHHLGARLHEVDYEDVVTEPRRAVAALLEFLGLAWDERCLSFHQSRRHVRTLSAWQVREPLYRYAIGRWRNYAEHIEPLRAAIGNTSAQ